MKRRFVRAVLASIAALGISAASASSAQAQEIELTGPLKGAPAVRHMRLYREGRFQIAPAISFSLLDQYRRTILVGATLNYNITDWLGIGVWGAYGLINSTTDLTDRIDQTAPRDALTATNVSPGKPGDSGFAGQTALLDWVVAPQLTFVPFRGKLAIFNKIFVDTDLYIAAGEAIAGIEERGNCGDTGQPPCSAAASFKRASSTKFSYGTYAIGLTFYPGDLWSLGVEYRAFPFAWNLAGFDSRGAGPNGNFPDFKVNSQDDTFHFNQVITIAVGFSFPTKPKISE
jgi:hypothetical protein